MLRTIAFLLVAFCLANRPTVGLGGTVYWSSVESIVDIVDLNNVRNNFGGTGLGDLTDDGKVDILDLNFVRNNMGGPIEPRPNSIRPENPTTRDEVLFHLQHPAKGGGCSADKAFGRPFLIISNDLRTLIVDFAPLEEPIACTDGPEPPVDGLDGTIGPLPAGRWTLGIAGQAPALQFDVVALNAVPEPGSWAIAVVGAGAIVTLRRRF